MRSDTFVYQAADLAYPDVAPFHPDAVYPELVQFGPRYATGPTNPTFAAVRETLAGYGLDAARYGTAEWNPLGDLVGEGQTIVIKPNLVVHETGALIGQRCLCTDGSVIRAVTDYAVRAVGSRGKVVIADVPLQGADFAALRRQFGLDAIESYWRDELGVDVTIADLRQEWAVLSDDGQIVRSVKLAGDPRGYTTVDIGNASFLEPLSAAGAQFGITDYNEEITNAHHQPGRHEYMLANTVLDADLVINLPKLKTHQKAGITAAMKNFVGINGSKAYLAHHRVGAPSRGGDEFPKQTLFNLAFREVRRTLNDGAPAWMWKWTRRAGLLARSVLTRNAKGAAVYGVGAGGWYGNETIWRTIYDINRAFFFYDRATRTLSTRQQRSYLAIVDGITAGEGEGPLRPSPVALRSLVIGQNPMAVDVVCAQIMGLDPRRIPFLREHARLPELPCSLDSGSGVASNSAHVREAMLRGGPVFKVQPPRGWRGHVEL